MAFLIGGANSAADTAFEVANSCRFNDGDTAHMYKSFGTPTSLTTWTMSAWVKRGVIGGANYQIWGNIDNGDTNNEHVRFNTDNTMQFQIYQSSATKGLLVTTQVFRDPSAWQHHVWVWDSSNGTAGDRMRWYVNGVEVTSFGTDTNPTQNLDSYWNSSGSIATIGSFRSPDGSSFAGTGSPLDSYLAEVVFIDGSALAPTSFGEFDEDSPTIWKPKDVSGLTFGNNGFYLDFKDSANLGNDANGGTDFTEVNLAATDSSTDTPTNNFCTLNSVELSTSATIAEGNTELRTTNNGYFGCYATMGFKYGFAAYWEVKIKTANRVAIGLSRKSADEARGDVITGEETEAGSTAFDYMWQPANANNVRYKGTSQSVTIAACSDDDICAFSVSSSGVVKIYLNDSLVHTYSTALQTSEESDRVDTWYFPVFACNAYATSPNYMHVNFGNPTYANTSSNADPDDYGAFEYATKSGYALCTKNLGAYGG